MLYCVMFLLFCCFAVMLLYYLVCLGLVTDDLGAAIKTTTITMQAARSERIKYNERCMSETERLKAMETDENAAALATLRSLVALNERLKSQVCVCVCMCVCVSVCVCVFSRPCMPTRAVVCDTLWVVPKEIGLGGYWCLLVWVVTGLGGYSCGW